MKRLLLTMSVLCIVFTTHAQFIWNDFDANQNVAFTGGSPDPTIIANPYSGGINTSVNVAEWVRGGWEWSFTKATAPGFIDFTTGSVFSLKVYSPIATTVLFKLEGNIGPMEVSQTVTAGSWQELSFDFTGAPNDAYNTIVIFFAPGTWGTEIYYFDDVEGPNYTVVQPKPYLAADVQDNFENNGWSTINEWFFQDPGMDPLPVVADPVDPNNNVADYFRDGSFEWTNSQAVLDHIMDLNERNQFELKVYFPSSNDYTGTLTPTVAMKLQNSELGGNAWTTQVEIVETITSYDSWVTVSFDFSGAWDRIDLDQIVVQMGGEGHATAGQFYFDDLELMPVVYPIPSYIYNDYDANQNHDFLGYPNTPVISTNPDQTGINTSANSAEWVRTADQWAHIYTILDGPINFSDGTNFQIKIISPIVCDVLLKLEDSNDPGNFVEQTATVINTNEWVLLNFNFPTAQSETYDKIIIFPDFASTDDNTFYIDDIEGPEYDEPKPILELNVQDNFENNGWSTIDYWILQDPNMDTLLTASDPANSSNTVANYNRSGSFEWTNAQTILDHRLDLSERNKFELKVYFPSSNDYTGALSPTASMKLQNSLLGGNAWSTQAEVINTIDVFDEWVTVIFDFDAWNTTIDYDQIVVQLGGEGHFVPGQFYYDDIALLGLNVVSPNGGESISQGEVFDIEWDYTWGDGSLQIELQKGNNTPELIAYNVTASDTIFNWTVIPDQEPGDDYRVIVTPIDPIYPSDTSDAYFTIVEVTTITPNFTADVINIAEGEDIIFTDESTGSPTTWEWTFEGGNPTTYSGQTPPAINYETSGVYDVTLVVGDGNTTYTELKVDYITVGSPPMADFVASTTAILVGQTVDFTSNSTGENLTFEWYFEGGLPETSTEENPSAIFYSEAGKFDVQLIVTNDYGESTLLLEEYIEAVPVGLIDVMSSEMNVWPNPTSGKVNISFNNSNSHLCKVIDLRGSILVSNVLNNQNNLVELSELKSGIYILSVKNEVTSEILIKKLYIN